MPKEFFPDQPLVTVITVVFNGAKYLEATIQSVLNLEYGNLEYLIIDGGSKDGTLDIIKKYQDRISRWVSEPDEGIYDAMNKGIALATGDWINFMNCGDRFATDEALNHFANDPVGDVLYGDAIMQYHNFETLYKKIPIKLMWRAMPFCHQASFVRTTVMKEFKFDTRYRLSADFDFLLRAYLAEKKFLYIDRLICYFNFKDGASKKHMFRSIYERRDSVLTNDHSIGKRLYYLFFIIYIRLSVVLKNIFGQKLTAWITKLLRT